MYIAVVGEKDPQHRLRLPTDGGLVHRLNRFMQEESITSTVSLGTWAPGLHVGFYEPKDAERVVEWLKHNGVEEDTNE